MRQHRGVQGTTSRSTLRTRGASSRGGLAGLALGAHALKILRSQRPLGGPGTPVLTDPAHDKTLLGSEAGQVDSSDLLKALEVRVVGGQVELEEAIVTGELDDAGDCPLTVKGQGAGLGDLIPSGGDLAAHVRGQLLAVSGGAVRAHTSGGATGEDGLC